MFKLNFHKKISNTKITILLISIIIFPISGEVYARYVLGLGNPPLYISHEEIEYMLKPNQDLYRFGNHFVVNQYGMRSQNFAPQAKSPNQLRIMVFGDSVINGGNLTDHQDLATTILQKQLSTSLTNPVIVGNISAGSWGPGNWLAYAKEYGFFEADIVILQINSRDWKDNPTFQPLNPNTHPTTKPFSAFTEGLTRYLPRYLPDFKFLNKQTKVKPQKRAEDPTKKGLDDLKNFLRMAKKSTQKVIVLQYLSRSELKNNKIKQGYYAISDMCEKLAIQTISLQPYFEQAMQKEEVYRDKIHPNQKGQKVIAQAMLKKLKPLLVKKD